MGIEVRFTGRQFHQLTQLLSLEPDEQLCFLLAEWDGDEAVVVDLREVPSRGFDLQSPWHLSLGDDERAGVIKWAHDGEAALIEVHSHVGIGKARFSASDLTGLEEFVPHVRWRLPGRPYTALVFDRGTFDGLRWDSSSRPRQVETIFVEGIGGIATTKRTLERSR